MHVVSFAGDMSSRRVQPEIQTKGLRFSPAGKTFSLSWITLAFDKVAYYRKSSRFKRSQNFPTYQPFKLGGKFKNTPHITKEFRII